MNADHPISMLIWVTFAAAIALGVFLLARIWRKPADRHPMDGERERNIDEIRDESEDGVSDRR